MKNKLLTGLVIAISILVLNGCTKEGPTGPAGKDGTNGTNGTNGNSDVQSVIVTPTWSWDVASNTLQADIAPLSILTTDISDNGAVLVYFKNSIGDWIPLPRTVYTSTSVSQSQRFSYTPYWLVLIIQNSDNTQPSGINFPFKVVCIDATAIISNPGVDYADYTAVKKAFNLED